MVRTFWMRATTASSTMPGLRCLHQTRGSSGGARRASVGAARPARRAALREDDETARWSVEARDGAVEGKSRWWDLACEPDATRLVECLMADPIPGRGVVRAADPVSHPRAWPNLTLTLRQIRSVDLAE
ncbi:MAG: hypothetical protein JWO67_3165 [Streptosporangiaceae bacterium]|nr:hypothetical protein [Streptosporangiaceae bacterium]